MGDVALIMAYDSKGQLLLGKRKDTGKYTLPAGHIEAGESPEDGARRELFEESGLKATSLSPLKVVETEHGKLHFFTAYVTGTPHGDNDPDDECGDSWEFVDVSKGLPKKFQALAGPEDDTNIVRQLFDMQKSERLVKSEDDEVSTLLSHPNPDERTMALKLDSVQHHHLQTASLDPHPNVYGAAIDHPKFDSAAGMHLLEAQQNAIGAPPTDAQVRFLNRPGMVTEHHLAAARAAAGGRLDDVLAIHPRMTPDLITAMHNDPNVALEHRIALLAHPSAPADLLAHAARTGILIPNEDTQKLAMTALAHPNMPQDQLDSLVRSATSPRAPAHVQALARHALATASFPHETIKDLLAQGKVRTDPAHAALRAAAVSGPAAAPEHINEVLHDRDPSVWKQIARSKALRPQHISVILSRLLAENPRDQEALKALAGAEGFGPEHMTQMLATPMAKSERLAKAIDPDHLKNVTKGVDKDAQHLVDHTSDLNAHPPQHSAEVEAYRQQVLHSPQLAKKKGKRESIGNGDGISKKTFFKAQVPGNATPSTYMVKPYHEKVSRGFGHMQWAPHQGWAEMTNQALFHAGGIGHLHQHVHVDEHNMGPGHEKEPALVVHVSPNHLLAADIGDYPATEDTAQHRLDMRKIAIMDMLANNHDRHGGNLMFNAETAAPLAIDHSRNFQYVSAPNGKGADSFGNYVNGSAIGNAEALHSHTGILRQSGETDHDYQHRRSNAIHSALVDSVNRYSDAFDWWGEAGPKIRQTFHDRLSQIKDPEVADHLKRNFDARADWLDERAKFGVGNYGLGTWHSEEVPLYPPGTLTEDEKSDPVATARAASLKADRAVRKKKMKEKAEIIAAAKEWMANQPNYDSKKTVAG